MPIDLGQSGILDDPYGNMTTTFYTLISIYCIWFANRFLGFMASGGNMDREMVRQVGDECTDDKEGFNNMHARTWNVI